ncbi:hypothetical protein KY348_01255 [Candidatus Woesearchaeota archaeon]|nr:hypothetical protein [Candidatus Woesearchaeota archaeon]
MVRAKIRFSDEAKEVLSFITESAANSKKEKMLLNAIMSKIEIIKKNPHYGNNIPKGLIPKYYKDKYYINNLFRIKLPLFWRMLYSLKKEKNEIEIISFVLDILDHKDYNKKFGYKKH